MMSHTTGHCEDFAENAYNERRRYSEQTQCERTLLGLALLKTKRERSLHGYMRRGTSCSHVANCLSATSSTQGARGM